MRLADIICPKNIIRPSDQQKDNNPAVVPLPPYKNITNLGSIVCSSHQPVLLRLLVCKELKENNGNCPFTVSPYTGHINNQSTKQICNEPQNKPFTQIYFRHENIDKKARSCIVAFVEGYRLHRTDELITKFQNTVKWLKIAKENPFFHVIYYGDPLFDNDTSTANKELDEKMRKINSQYSKDEVICFITYATQKSQFLRLNHTTIFSVKAQ
jgi:hypothetical protein